jgi:hypothetical protein
MELFIEIVLWVVLGAVLEAAALFFVDKFRKGKIPTDKTEVDADKSNFIMRYTKDMKSLIWVLVLN